jgi:predicted dehydrogenase/nucleoside-diphosphate-sugar epimerase
MSLRIAFIGAGQMARHHLGALRRVATPHLVVGVHDAVPECAGEFAAGAGTRPYVSVPALLAEARPDVVHVCTPPAAHVDAAAAALQAGAHVYVEKPFARTADEARALIALAERQGRLLCAGHQLLRDPAFVSLGRRATTLGPIVQVDSHFAFRPAGAAAARGEAAALAAQLLDILPHPLYSLVSMLEACAGGAPVTLAWSQASPRDVQAVFNAGSTVGRLSVSLRARPVASTLTVTGSRGSLTADFVRSMEIGTGNPGTEALEKILNPIVEAAQLGSRTALSLGRRLMSGGSYPGLAELIGGFYRAIRDGAPAPVSPAHLMTVTGLFETLATQVETARDGAAAVEPIEVRHERSPLVAVTGSRGFLGAEVARRLARVRGIGRSGLATAHAPGWVTADLSRGLAGDALRGVDVVVHAAAETAGGFEAHQRNTIDATRHLLRAMHAAGVRRLVLVSSLSVLQPPRTPWERQHERTPKPEEPRRFGAYTWGKALQEALVQREAPGLGIAVRIVRPAALLSRQAPELPGLMGRRLFGRWHLGLGRPGLPIAVCDVAHCADVIAWSAEHFDDAPPVINLIDPAIPTRGALLDRLRADGWTGRMIWMPISAIAFGLTAARTVLSVARGRRPEPLAAWAVLRPRRYDTRVAAAMLGRAREGPPVRQAAEAAVRS